LTIHTLVMAVVAAKALQTYPEHRHLLRWTLLLRPLECVCAIVATVLYNSFADLPDSVTPHNLLRGSLQMVFFHAFVSLLLRSMAWCSTIDFSALTWRYLGVSFVPIGALMHFLAVFQHLQHLATLFPNTGRSPRAVGHHFQQSLGLEEGLLTWTEYQDSWDMYLRSQIEIEAFQLVVTLPLYWVPLTHFSVQRVSSGNVHKREVVNVVLLALCLLLILMFVGLSSDESLDTGNIELAAHVLAMLHLFSLTVVIAWHKDEALDASEFLTSSVRPDTLAQARAAHAGKTGEFSNPLDELMAEVGPFKTEDDEGERGPGESGALSSGIRSEEDADENESLAEI